MELALMRYKGYAWRCNPLSIEIHSQRSEAKYKLPFHYEYGVDLGAKCRVIKGEGKFFGEDCLEQYARLYRLQQDGVEGVLSLPGLKPIIARFTELKAKADVTPDTVNYSFVFVEVIGTRHLKKKERTHVVNLGETLFDIAYIYAMSVSELIRLNPSVKRPDELKAGEVIKLC